MRMQNQAKLAEGVGLMNIPPLKTCAADSGVDRSCILGYETPRFEPAGPLPHGRSRWANWVCTQNFCAQLQFGGAILLIGTKIGPLNIWDRNCSMKFHHLQKFRHPAYIIFAFAPQRENPPFQIHRFSMTYEVMDSGKDQIKFYNARNLNHVFGCRIR